MKIASITQVGKREVFDISVDEAEHYILENGVVTHNTGVMYSSDNVWIIGRQQEKDGDDIVGWNFVINIEKSRYTKEKTKIPILVTFEGGIDIWSGFLDNALESGHIAKNSGTKPHRYNLVDLTTGEIQEPSWTLKEIPSSVWKNLMKDQKFIDFIANKYSVSGNGPLIGNDDDE